jgi:hypothetical protein
MVKRAPARRRPRKAKPGTKGPRPSRMPAGCLGLILLLLGAGIERKKAITWALGVESTTIVGGVIGFYLVNSTSTFWLGILFAHVAGGFFYMITSAIRGVLGQHTEEPRYAPACTGERLVFRFQRSPSWLGYEVTRAAA